MAQGILKAFRGQAGHLLKVKWIWQLCKLDTAGSSTSHICCAPTLVLHQSYVGFVPNKLTADFWGGCGSAHTCQETMPCRS